MPRRRSTILVGTVSLLAAATLTLHATTTTQAATSPPFLPYSSNAYLQSAPGPIDWTLTNQMRTFMATFADQKATHYPLLNGTGTNKWGMPYRQGTASDPIWKMTGNVPASSSFLKTTGFHAPADLCSSLTGTSDSPMTVMDLADGMTVTAGKVACGSATNHIIQVNGTAGAFFHNSNGLDKRRPESDSTKNWGSRGRIPDTMLIRKDRLDWAVANNTDLGYVLEIYWPETDSSAGFRFPMVGAEGSKSGWGAEGQRISIDPSINLATRNCTPYAYAIALSLQRHGAYIGDNAGGAADFKVEQDTTAHPVWHGTLSHTELAGCVSWNDFVVNTTPK